MVKEIYYIIYWVNPKDGVGPLGIIGIFPNRKMAVDFMTSHFTSDECFNKVQITNGPYYN